MRNMVVTKRRHDVETGAVVRKTRELETGSGAPRERRCVARGDARAGRGGGLS